MTSEAATGNPPATSGRRARTLAAQGVLNRIVRGVLRTPLLSRIAGRRLVTLYVVGRKSGRRYAVPVAYAKHEGGLLIGTPFGWGRNLRTGEPAAIRLQGRRRLADVQVLTDETGVTDAYAVMCRANRSFARFNNIGFAADGNPDPGDLRLAWAAGARAFRLTPRVACGDRNLPAERWLHVATQPDEGACGARRAWCRPHAWRMDGTLGQANACVIRGS